jgi:putative tryptophan/tyrosine transport system substrate-binding protein
VRRREFIAGLVAATAWPVAAHAQQGRRVAQVGFLVLRNLDDPLEQMRFAWFKQSLQALGWTEGRNLRLTMRGAGENAERMGVLAKEIVDLQPDVIAVAGGRPTLMVQQQTRSVPIVFVQAGDAIANGLVKNIARPEGNTTGISNNLPSFGGKWLELLKEAAPRIARVALIFNPDFTIAPYSVSVEEAAERYGVTAFRTPVRTAAEIERAIDAFAAQPDGGLIELPPPLVADQRQLMYLLAQKHRLPAIYGQRTNVVEGGMMSYGPDTADLYRLAASYVDRILRGAKPGELPVQFPTKFELVVNLKVAKAIGLAIAPSFLLRADEVIE